MFKLIISLSFLGCFCASAWSAAKQASPPIESVYFNFGTHTEFYNAVQIDDSGGMRKFEIAPTIGAGLKLPLDYGWRFLPELNWVLPFSEGNSKIIQNLFMLRADFGYDPLEWLRLRIGTSLMFLNQHGRGGTTTIDNGNGASTFYYPDENHSSLNNTFDLGAEFIYDEWSFRFQTYTYSIFKEERRQLSYSLLISYDWDL
ncbi:MAG TPA: hypothetical protein VNJ08_17420 [Bacteriovoracaceae bacterium]|nr:hypothetical protein [Bacteriovoracaceae bacterium]